MSEGQGDPHWEEYQEHHYGDRANWLRAAVLGANDGIVSTSSLIIGVAAAQSSQQAVLVAGLAGLVAGAMSMAAGEYVSVSSQADSERADLELERRELERSPEYEVAELAGIYVARGLEPALAREVAEKLMHHDALGSHARDELGLSHGRRARPVQAAAASALSFAVGAAVPLATVAVVPLTNSVPVVALLSIGLLGSLGGLSARIGGAPPWRPALRVSFWGALAMAATAAVGSLFGVLG